MGDTESWEPQPSDYYAAQLYGTSQFIEFYDSTGIVRYSRENKPEWAGYADITYDMLEITGDIFKDSNGFDAIKIHDLHIK